MSQLAEPILKPPPLRVRVVVVHSVQPQPRPPVRRSGDHRARAAVLWGLGLFVLLQAASAWLLDRRLPELRDPEYGHKLARLRRQRAAEPDRPLVLVLGSSRAEMGFRPDALLPAYTSAGEAVSVFNFALSGSGVLRELLCLRRLLDEGIRPDYVLIEVLPPRLPEESEEHRLPMQFLSWNDLAVVRDYSPRPADLYGRWARGAVVPWHANRFCLMSHLAPAWLPWQCRRDHVWARMDEWGWLRDPRSTVSAEHRRHELERAREEHLPYLTHFRIAAGVDRMLRDLLGLCRREDIAAALFLMPESAEFRGWYPPSARALAGAYLEQVSREHDVPVIDASDWAADEAFVDGHHLMPHGAAAFTERFGREGLQPFLAGGLRPSGAVHSARRERRSQ